MRRERHFSRRRLSATPAWLCAGLLAGCSVGPDYHGPPAAEYTQPAKFKNPGAMGHWKIAEPADDKSRAPWWKIFGDPQLDAYIAQAQAGNQDLRVAAARIAEARGMDRVAASDFYPHLDFEGSAMRMRTSNTEPIETASLVGPNPFGGSSAGGASGGTGSETLSTQPLSTTYNLFRTPVDLNWELDLFGRVRRNREAARSEAQAVQADFQNMSLSVSANVAVNYFMLRSLDSELDVLEKTIDARKEELRISVERLQAGMTSELDVDRAKNNLATNQTDLYALSRTREEVVNALATLIGQPASLLRVPNRPLDARATPPSVPAGLPSDLLERRPDVASAERELAAANARIGVAKAAFYPVVHLTGAAGFESADLGMLFSWESSIWQIGPSITFPIFEGGRNKANLDIANARYDEAVGRYRGQVLVAFQDVESALGDLQMLTQQAEAQNRATDSASRTLELSRKEYARGSVTFLDVLDAERDLLASQRASAQIQGQRLQATVQLIKALGGGWH
jgi:multidrug efflux system outer membrane protein